MKNVSMAMKGSTLTITVDLSKRFGNSQSGKTIIIASTEGPVGIDGGKEAEGVKVGLNIYVKPKT